jgi:hypothetical protein
VRKRGKGLNFRMIISMHALNMSHTKRGESEKERDWERDIAITIPHARTQTHIQYRHKA